MEHSPISQVQIDVRPGSSPDVAILKATGPLTIHNFFDFQALSREQAARVLLVDLSDVPYIDSAALGSLVGVHVSRMNSAKRYAIVGANDRLQRMFEVTGVGQFLVTFPSADLALAQFANAGA